MPYGETATYGAFTQHVKQIAHIFDSDLTAEAWTKLRDATAELVGESDSAVVADDIGSLIGLETEASAAGREELFYSARRLIEGLARRQPTLLVFEDVHWADAGTLDLLEALASRLRDVPLVIFALARPELLETKPSWGGGLPGYTALPLEPLGEPQARELAERLLADTGLEPEAIVGTAEGNPLFIEELAAAVSEQGSDGTGNLPTSIRAIVAARLDSLPSDERSVLLDASVIGKVFWRAALAEMGSGGERLGQLLDSLEGRDFVRREAVSRLRGEQQFSFKHELIRDIAYATLPRPARRDRHATVAAFLEASTPELAAASSALAHHWREAGEPVRAADQLTVAGDQAGRGWAKDEAVTFYREALAVLPEDERERRREITRRNRRRAPGRDACRGRGATRPPGRVRARRRSVLSQRKVVGRHVAGDLVDRDHVVHAQLLRVTAHDLLARRVVEAEGLHRSRVVHDHVAVLPDDLGEVLVPDLSRASPDLWHPVLGDVIGPFD